MSDLLDNPRAHLAKNCAAQTTGQRLDQWVYPVTVIRTRFRTGIIPE
ncbi:hypothetical protein FHS29_006308 [Saccharothrix tamanrassetensis]|uniref:Uncharacterized protein n=1 Tax=Saccharothrix tamanrassetensis TaxID=1051531 RepID=A0A841CUI2_9PSEU|nr:hypothetical protein [Saccharothrix tamanrassetensis]MBB5959687.1 hypothetical protein [Saccharothrix tamanrassetensis]